MKVLGALESAQIEWFLSSALPAASSYPFRVVYATDTKQILVSDGTTWRPTSLAAYTSGTLPAAASSNQYLVAFLTDTLQVKVSNGTVWTTVGARLDTYTSGTIPAAASNTNQIIWVSDLQQVQVSNGTAWVAVGATSGLKNYFSQNNANPNFETNSVSPWSACTLTFSSGVPSGAPTLTATQMAIAATASSPLAGTYSLQLTKSAANAQYQGFISGALTIDREDTAKVLYGSFSYEVVSGTVDFSGASTQTYEIWIYNTVSGAWTQPAGYRGMNQSSGQGKVTFSFQTDGSTANNSYKIAVITQQTGTTNIVVKFDSFQIGPSAIVLGAAMTDWVAYTPTTAGLGTISAVNMFWRRVGSDVEVMGTLTTGTVTAVEAQIGLPAGITSTSTIPTIQQAGVIVLGAVTSNFRNLLIETTKTYLTVGISNATSQLTKQLGTTFANTIVLSFQASVPVSGWSSNVQISSDTDTRVISAQAGCSTAFAYSATVPINFDTVVTDKSGSVTPSATVWKFTAPVSGDYRVSTNLINGTGSISVVLYKNGVSFRSLMSVTTAAITSASTTITLNAGEYIDIRGAGAATLVSGTTVNTISIERLSGPSVVAASETVAARYYSSSTAISGTFANITYATKDYDTHNAYSGGIFTVPVSGKYQINAGLSFTFASSSNPESRIAIFKGATQISEQLSFMGAAAQSSTPSNITCDIVNCIAGDQIIIKGSCSGTTPVIRTSNFFNYVSIVRVGN